MVDQFFRFTSWFGITILRHSFFDERRDDLSLQLSRESTYAALILLQIHRDIFIVVTYTNPRLA